MAYSDKNTPANATAGASSGPTLIAWLALAGALTALGVAVAAAAVLGGRYNRLAEEKGASAQKAAALEAANADLAASVKSLSGRLSGAEERCRQMETRATEDEKRLRELSAALAAREEAARQRAAAERPEKPRAEGEKAPPPDAAKQAEQVRAAILDGLGEVAAIQQQVKDGKITQEEARKLIQEKMRARFEEFAKTLPEDQRKKIEELMKNRRGGGGGAAPAPVPAPDKEQF